MLNDKETRKTILIGVVTAVIVVLFVEPILNLLGVFITWLGTNVYEGISSQMYRDASLGLREKYSFMLLAIFLGVLSGIATAFSQIIVVGRKSRSEGQSLGRRKLLRIGVVLASLYISVGGLYLLTTSFAGFQMNASFNQHLTIVRPVISDQQFFALKANWASMKTRDEYLNIVQEIHNIAQQNAIELPERLWK